MTIIHTHLPGVAYLEQERHSDTRGWFARTWCNQELADKGIPLVPAQCSSSFNHQRGTLRGMHYQKSPHQENKLVRCTRGSIIDVALDLRPDSPTYLQWFKTELSASNGRALYVPAGCAHGFQTLEPDSEVFYMIDQAYVPNASIGVRWNDPAFSIDWPLPQAPILSERDANLPDFTA